MKLAEFIYTVVLKPKPIKALANAVIRAVLPRTARYDAVKVVLNPRDPVISGALAFHQYEREELAFVRKTLRPGMVVLDIGANVGLYAALAGHAVGPTGRVLAFEPDPESYEYLQRTIRENGLANVQAFPLAASEASGTARLYVSASNRGDNRLYDNELSTGSVTVETVRLDEHLEKLAIGRVDFIKLDVQGFEGRVLAGLEQTIRRSSGLVILSEFWPDGLRRAGTDPLQFLERLESWGLRIQELHSTGPRPVADRRAFVERYRGRQYTNIVAAQAAAPPAP